MKKTYTKKQILESIKYWTKKLNMMNETRIDAFKSDEQWKQDIQDTLNKFKNGEGFYKDIWEKVKNALSNDAKVDLLTNYVEPILYDIIWGIEWLFVDDDGLFIDNTDTFDEYVSVTGNDFIEDAIIGDKTYLNAYINGVDEYKYDNNSDSVKENPNRKQNAVLCKKFFTELYNIIHDKTNPKTFTIDYTAWHQDKYQIEVEAKDEAEARKKFLAENPERYDFKDIEIEDIHES